jgi:hypothetical protein
MTAPQKLAQLITNEPQKALRVANLMAQNITMARAIKYVEMADKEARR